MTSGEEVLDAAERVARGLETWTAERANTRRCSMMPRPTAEAAYD